MQTCLCSYSSLFPICMQEEEFEIRRESFFESALGQLSSDFYQDNLVSGDVDYKTEDGKNLSATKLKLLKVSCLILMEQ